MSGLFRRNGRPPDADCRDPPCDCRDRVTGVAHAAEVVRTPWPLYFDAARGAFSHNTERALRADVEIFAVLVPTTSSGRRCPPASPTVVAFIDDMARVKTPATVRRYVSSIATVHKALRQTNPLESAVGPLRPATDAPAPGASAGASPGADLADAKPTCWRRPETG